MSKFNKVNAYGLHLKDRIAHVLFREKAIDCGYAALASAIEGKAWERNRYFNMMRRLVALGQLVETVPSANKNRSLK